MGIFCFLLSADFFQNYLTFKKIFQEFYTIRVWFWLGLMLNIPTNSYGPAYYHSFLLNKLNQYFVHILSPAEGRRMAIEIISRSISMKVWDRAGIKLATPKSAVRHVSAVRHSDTLQTELRDQAVKQFRAALLGLNPIFSMVLCT